MKKIVCEMCEGTEFVKVGGMFECQECGCKYTIEDAKQLMREIEEEPEAEPEVETEEQEYDPRDGYPLHTRNSPNRISVEVIKVGHETYTAASSISILWGEPTPVFVSGPDVVGHIGTEITIKHHTGKPIKYIKVFLTPINAVGDEVFCEVEGHSTMSINVTGPLEAGEYWNGYCEDMWYNGSIVDAEVAFATVDYMDGSKELFEARDLLYTEGGNAGMVAVNVTYTSRAGAPTMLMYTMDDGDRINLNQQNTFVHYLTPGMHTLTTRNPFTKKSYSFQARDNMRILVEGNGLKMNITEG